MVIITGATGHLGRAIVERLIKRIPANDVGVSVRDPAKAIELGKLGVRVRRGDYADPESLRHAFEGANQILFVSSNARAHGGDTLAQHRSVIDAARAAGAKRVVYTSHMAASADSAFPPARDHAATEEMLGRSGLAWTALRNGFYAASGIALIRDALETGVLEAPTDGKVSWTAHADLAEAAAIILTHEWPHNGPTPPLTGAETLDLSDMTGIASELLGRSVCRRILTDEELRARLAERGVPRHIADISLGFYLAGRKDEFASVDPTLEQLLGRRPIGIGELIAQKLGRWDFSSTAFMSSL